MKLNELKKALPHLEDTYTQGIYPHSIEYLDNTWFFMNREPESDKLIVCGKHHVDFEGQVFDTDSMTCVCAPLKHTNGDALRHLFPYTKPIPVLHEKRSFGLGDRIGLATPGHIRVFNMYDAYPIFAQQSIRELNLTNRTYEDVLDAASFAVFREGYKRGFGADGDHLKKPSEVEYALRLGFTMITLDCSDYIRNDVQKMTKEQIDHAITLDEALKDRYLKNSFDVEGHTIEFSEEELKRCVLVYGKAITFAGQIYQTYFANQQKKTNFEISIDETATPTTPEQHYFVANELKILGVKIDTLAPRFCGEFQKGVDYIGDIKQFEKELKIHSAIARDFGYKLSIHSGSDKFSIFELIGKHTKGNFHVKTAGTNWLEAMRVVANSDPQLYRAIHTFALSKFEEAKKFYHVTTDLGKIPQLDTLDDRELKNLFNQNDARQLIHITYGFILNHKDTKGHYVFKDKLYQLWRNEENLYSEALEQHIGKHLRLLYQGFKS
ncbi:MAG: tagaturonate epimerase family protein [Acholeplasmataceae bacterium]|jgi:hypothetical protein|nr:tagaturonate epimerase family protein [Acholeplasmataceae bacterium]